MSVRKDTNESLRNPQKDGAPDDAVKHAEDQVQKFTDQFSIKLDELLIKKKADIIKF